MSGGGGDTTTVQKDDPWAGQQPYLTQGFQQASENLNTPSQYFPNQTFIPRGEYETGADKGLINYARTGMASQATDAMRTQQIMTNAPDLANNPYVGQYANAMNQRLAQDYNQSIAPDIRNQAVSAGQFGSSRHGVAEGIGRQGLARAMGDQTASFYNEAYGQGLEQQAKGMAFAPQTMQMGLTPFQTISEAGGRFTADQQRYLNEDMARWQFAQTERDDALSRYMGAIRGDYGGSSSSTGPDPNAISPIAGAAGGAMAGGAIGGMFAGGTQGSTMGPYGAAAGAVLGLLLS